MECLSHSRTLSSFYKLLMWLAGMMQVDPWTGPKNQSPNGTKDVKYWKSSSIQESSGGWMESPTSCIRRKKARSPSRWLPSSRLYCFRRPMLTFPSRGGSSGRWAKMWLFSPSTGLSSPSVSRSRWQMTTQEKNPIKTERDYSLITFDINVARATWRMKTFSRSKVFATLRNHPMDALQRF